MEVHVEKILKQVHKIQVLHFDQVHDIDQLRNLPKVQGESHQSPAEVEVLWRSCFAPSLLSRLEVLDSLFFCASDSLDDDELLLEVTVLEVVGVLLTARATRSARARDAPLRSADSWSSARQCPDPQ